MFTWLLSRFPCPPSAARKHLLRGRVPSRMQVVGKLDLSRTSIRLLPATMAVQSLDVSDCRQLVSLPYTLKCEELLLARTPVEALPPQLNVARRVDARDCLRLQHVYPLQVPVLSLQGCISLSKLPEGLAVADLNVSGCVQLTELPASLARHCRRLNVQGCARLTALPDEMMRLEELNIRDCASLTALPENIRVRSWIDVAGSSLKELPWTLRSVRVLWRGVPISDRIAFEPETITADEILEEPNQTMRQILLERMGLEAFFEQARAEVVDQDCDAGGERKLLRMRLPGNEQLVCVKVCCPSTGHHYVLRVPPNMQTCRQAIAWTAGYGNPAEYQPVKET